jgi:intraflagellar transport protein 46
MQIDIKLKPFIPDYIPAIGEVDAFLKINRPDNISEHIGLNFIDEPTIIGRIGPEYILP